MGARETCGIDCQKPKKKYATKGRHIPIAIAWNHIVDPKLLTDLLNTKVKCVSFKLLASEVRHDHGRQAHETGSLVLLLVAPTVALLAPLGAIGGEGGFGCNKKWLVSNDFLTMRLGIHTSDRAAATLGAIRTHGGRHR